MAMTLVALVLVAALNPLVVRSPEPHGNVPANCEVSDAPAAPRAAPVAVAEVDDPGVPLPQVRPATRTQGQQTQYDVRPLQQALAANNRAQFDAELARARDAGVPTRVYEDVGRLWDAQFESPFFAEGSEPHRIASQYPGYEAAVREQIFTDASGKKFYPASESKAFVARQTGANLPATRATARTTTQQPSNRVTQQPSSRPTTRVPPPRSDAGTTTRNPTPKPRNPATSTKTAVARQDPAPPRRSPDPSAAQRPAATVPAPVVPPVENTSSTTAPPAAGSLPADPIATTTTADPLATDTTDTDTDATDTMVTDTATTATETTATDTTATTTTTGTAAQPGRSIVLPAILILIGLGVLILLFKAK